LRLHSFVHVMARHQIILHMSNGTRYKARTTVQYGYRPPNNYATTTVEPQATQVEVPTANVTATETKAEIPPPEYMVLLFC